MIPGYHRILHQKSYNFRKRYVDIPEVKLGIGQAEQMAFVPLIIRLHEHRFNITKADIQAVRRQEQAVHSEGYGHYTPEHFPREGRIGGALSRGF